MKTTEMKTAPKFTPALDSLLMIYQGKSRDTFETNSYDKMLIVATKRLSTHNIVHVSEIPYKDQVLTALTVFQLKDLLEKAGIRHHLVAYGTDIYRYLPGKRSDYPSDLHHRAIVVKKLKVIPVEFIFRGYLAGSLFDKFYSKGRPNPYGVLLEPGLQLMTQFPVPLFTPTEKSATDDPLDATETITKYSGAFDLSLTVFKIARNHLNNLGLELVDSKFEVGFDAEGNLTVADEIVTPDSSRFCDLLEIKIGQNPPWLDKQIARDAAERIWGTGKKYPLEFSPEIVRKLSETYLEIFRRITGFSLQEFQQLNFEK